MAHDFIDWSDWVAVKKNPFSKKQEKNKLIFTVAWNIIEKKISITCQEHHRIAKDNECRAWTRLLPMTYLAYVHQQLSLVYPSLNQHYFLKNTWQSLTPEDLTDNDCKLIEQYLLTALEICGQSLLISVIFENEETSDEEYLEDINELNRQNYEDAYKRSLEELETILEMREKADNMLHMTTVYALEDEVIANASIALAELYNYHLQPFLNLRELSYSKLQSSRALLNSDDVGARIKECASQEYADWQLQYIKSIDGVRNLYIDYYTKTTDLVTGQRDRMLEDKQKFGRSTFELYALSRLEHLELFFHEERLKLLHSKRLLKEHTRDKLKQKLLLINESNSAMEIDDIENEIYQRQIQVLDLRLEILQEEEAMLKKKISVIAKPKHDSCEEGEFYDAVEDLDELVEEEINSAQDPQISALKDKLASVFRRRAVVRNKKKSCASAREKHLQSQEAKAVLLKKHHSVQLKRQERLRMESKRKKQIEEERKLTIQRLRAYRLKNNQRKFLSEQDDILSSGMNSSETIQNNSEETIAEDGSQILDDHEDSPIKADKNGQQTVKCNFSRGDLNWQYENDSCCSQETISSVSSVPLPPPPPPLPPPLPPLPSFNVSSNKLSAKNPSEPTLSVHCKDKNTSFSSQNRSNAAIDFEELQAVRKRLRKISDLSDLKTSSEVSRGEKFLQSGSQTQQVLNDLKNQKDMSDMLIEALHRIRVITVDSDDSESYDSYEEEFN